MQGRGDPRPVPDGTGPRSGSSPIKSKSLLILLAVAGGLWAYYHFVYRRAHFVPFEIVYALGKSVEVTDSAAEVRGTIATMKPGDRAEVLKRTQNWMKVRLEDGQVGWVEAKNMLDAVTFQGGRRLFESLARTPVQAAGRSRSLVKLRLGPARDASQIGQLEAQEKVDIFDRRLVDVSSEAPCEAATSAGESVAEGAPRREAWYLVRSGPKAGWALGRLIDLDVPESVAAYAQGTNMVAWLVLNTVDDEGQKVPQYLAADRKGTQEADFNHIRVLTWWPKTHHYVTAYVESNLNGHFPIRVARVDGKPVFRLRLVDSQGNRFQRVYELSDTLTRLLGTVEGWESDAMPPSRPPSRRRSQGRRGQPARRGPAR